MTVYIDCVGHLVADSLDELHEFAYRLGLKRRWFQDKRLPHYDLTTARKRRRAVIEGAWLVTSREIVVKARELRDKGGKTMPGEGGG